MDVDECVGMGCWAAGGRGWRVAGPGALDRDLVAFTVLHREGEELGGAFGLDLDPFLPAPPPFVLDAGEAGREVANRTPHSLPSTKGIPMRVAILLTILTSSSLLHAQEWQLVRPGWK